MEAACLLGAYWYYVGCSNCGHQWGGNKKKDPQIEVFANCLLTHKNVDRWGPEMQHKSVWTGCWIAQEMAELGFYIRHNGMGMTHGMGRRDFRVEGVKV